MEYVTHATVKAIIKTEEDPHENAKMMEAIAAMLVKFEAMVDDMLIECFDLNGVTAKTEIKTSKDSS